MKDPKHLKDLIVETVDLADVMVSYGVSFSFNPKLVQEVQFKCPFHGDDNKPSARLYRETKTCYCWVCRRAWDVVSFVQQKESLGFIDTLKTMVRRYNVDISSIPDEPEIKKKKVPVISAVNVRLISLKSRIKWLFKKIEFDKYRALCSSYYMLSYRAYCNRDILPLLDNIESKLSVLEKGLLCQ